jgi:hypothetical protein
MHLLVAELHVRPVPGMQGDVGAPCTVELTSQHV